MIENNTKQHFDEQVYIDNTKEGWEDKIDIGTMEYIQLIPSIDFEAPYSYKADKLFTIALTAVDIQDIDTALVGIKGESIKVNNFNYDGILIEDEQFDLRIEETCDIYENGYLGNFYFDFYFDTPMRYLPDPDVSVFDVEGERYLMLPKLSSGKGNLNLEFELTLDKDLIEVGINLDLSNDKPLLGKEGEYYFASINN